MSTLALLSEDEQERKRRYPPKIATGEIRVTMALTEPSGGSDLQARRTVARREADGCVVSGSKTWITNSRRSQVLLCKTDPDAAPAHQGDRLTRPAQARLQGCGEL